MKNWKLIVYWIARLTAAVIMLQTLFFKFSGSSESVYIFEQVHMEPWGRIGVGVAELVATVLLLLNTTAWVGALLALGLMSGAIIMHLTTLGIEVQGDGGYLFFLAVMVAACSLYIVAQNKKRITDFISNTFTK
jgi:putative oxidoreductase